MEETRRAIEDVFRREHGRILAALLTRGSFEEAEEALQEAFLVALDRWGRDGLPEKPAALMSSRNLSIIRNGSEAQTPARTGVFLTTGRTSPAISITTPSTRTRVKPIFLIWTNSSR